MAGEPVRRRRDPHDGRRHPRRRRAAHQPRRPAGRRDARAGTTTVEIKSGYGLTVHDEARAWPSPGSSPARRRSSAPTSCPPSATTARRTSTWSPARCSTPARRTPAGSTCSASAAPSTSTRRARSSPPVPRPGCARLHANQLGTRPRGAAGRRARAARSTTAPTLRRGRRRARRQLDGRHAAARGGVLHRAP